RRDRQAHGRVENQHLRVRVAGPGGWSRGVPQFRCTSGVGAVMEHRCPSCHASFSLETLAEDEALRELMALLAELPRETSRPLVLYIGLFRGKTRAPAYERQLRLAREVLALHADIPLLGAALSETVEAIRAKRDSGEDNRPLKNH